MRGRILIVDDDNLVLSIVKKRLENVGFQVTVRSEAVGTLKAIHDLDPTVVMVDLKMPAINGEGLAELVRKNTKIPVIIHSSEPLAVLQEKARATGAVGAIAKTPDDNLFIAQFERLFARCTASGARSSEKDSQDTGRNSEPKPNY